VKRHVDRRPTRAHADSVDLARPQALALPPLRPGERGYEIEFQQKVSPPPPGPENRRLGFFLREVRLR
jgi:hypothetical protein